MRHCLTNPIQMKCLLACGMFMLASLAQAGCPSISSEVEALINQHTYSVKGAEYCRFRTVHKQPGIELVLYSIIGPCYEGGYRPGSCGNHYFRSMVGVINGQKYPPIMIGGKGVFQSKDIDYSDGIITIQGLAYKRSDPFCCPSITSERKYQVGVSEFEPMKPLKSNRQAKKRK